jgi:hypothetical protein
MIRIVAALAVSVALCGCAGFREKYSPSRYAFRPCLGKGLECDPKAPPRENREAYLPGQYPSPIHIDVRTEGPVGITF